MYIYIYAHLAYQCFKGCGYSRKTSNPFFTYLRHPVLDFQIVGQRGNPCVRSPKFPHCGGSTLPEN